MRDARCVTTTKNSNDFTERSHHESRITHHEAQSTKHASPIISPTMSTGKTIVLGVTGSIAAYKAVDIASLLVKAGHQVHTVMTADALKFITPLPFKTLSRH